MKLRLYAMVLAASALALGACSSEEDGEGTGGSGNEGGGTGNTGGDTGATGGMGTGGDGATGGNGTGGAGDCRSCAEYFTDASEQMSLEPDGPPLCEGSDEIWGTLLSCACEGCLDVCSADACEGGTGNDPDACSTCLPMQITSTCSAEAGECANDA